MVVLTGMFCLAWVPSQLGTDAAGAAAQVGVFRAGIAAFLLMQVAFLLLPLAMYRVLGDINRHAAVAMVALATVSVPIGLVTLSHRLEALALLESIGQHPPASVDAAFQLSLQRYGHGMFIAKLFWGLWLLPFGWRGCAQAVCRACWACCCCWGVWAMCCRCSVACCQALPTPVCPTTPPCLLHLAKSVAVYGCCCLACVLALFVLIRPEIRSEVNMQTAVTPKALADPPLPQRLKLSAAWASLTFCYLYGDYFGLYKPGKLQHMLDGVDRWARSARARCCLLRRC